MVSNVCVQFALPSSVGFTHQPSRMPAKRVDKEMAKAEALQVADYLEKDVLVLKLAWIGMFLFLKVDHSTLRERTLH